MLGLQKPPISPYSYSKPIFLVRFSGIFDAKTVEKILNKFFKLNKVSFKLESVVQAE